MMKNVPVMVTIVRDHFLYVYGYLHYSTRKYTYYRRETY
jgi:hypothetical protein